jgi:hypothetical protein
MKNRNATKHLGQDGKSCDVCGLVVVYSKYTNSNMRVFVLLLFHVIYMITRRQFYLEALKR